MSQTYRPDIEGLRSVAALLVAVYHIWLGRVSGGVDVFFVVSGFLITNSLVRQIQETGELQFGQFWARLLKRLVPSAYLVILAVILASPIFVPRTQWVATIEQAAASAVYLENWWLALNGVEYLARELPPSPFQHYWALSTQGQFYLLWPLVFWGALKLRRSCGQFPTRNLIVAFTTLFIVSFTYSVLTTRTDQAFAYFDVMARVWEFSLGGLLSLMLPSLTLGPFMAAIVGWVGFVGLVSCGLVLDVGGVFPGYAALWPTLSAAAILVAGKAPGPMNVRRLLGARPLELFGGISYAFYLWHWPLLIFTLNYRVQDANVGILQGLLIILFAGVLAWLSTRYVETPLRRLSILRGRGLWSGIGMGVTCGIPVVLALGMSAMYINHEKQGWDNLAPLNHPEYPGAVAMLKGSTAANDYAAPPLPGPFAVTRDLPVQYRDGCHQNEASEEPVFCVYGDPDGDTIVAAVGGSHVVQWMPALDLMGKKEGIKALSISKSGCVFLSEADWPTMREYPECLVWRSRVLDLLPELNLDAVFTTGTRGRGMEERVPDMYLDVWRRLEIDGIKVIALRDAPPRAAMRRIHACVDFFGPESARCWRRRADALGDFESILGSANIPGNVRWLDLSDAFCGDEFCYPVIGNVVVYRDWRHITASYASTLAGVLQARLVPLLSE